MRSNLAPALEPPGVVDRAQGAMKDPLAGDSELESGKWPVGSQSESAGASFASSAGSGGGGSGGFGGGGFSGGGGGGGGF